MNGELLILKISLDDKLPTNIIANTNNRTKQPTTKKGRKMKIVLLMMCNIIYKVNECLG